MKPKDRTFFAICGAAGALILIGCVLPTFEHKRGTDEAEHHVPPSPPTRSRARAAGPST